MTESPRLLCQIYKSPLREEMFLYIDRARGLDPVPEALLASFGKPQSIMMMLLTPEQSLARVDARKVIEAIRDKGYYLQMPPSGDALSRDRAFDIGGHSTS